MLDSTRVNVQRRPREAYRALSDVERRRQEDLLVVLLALCGLETGTEAANPS